MTHLSVESLQVTQANVHFTKWYICIRSRIFFIDRSADLREDESDTEGEDVAV